VFVYPKHDAVLAITSAVPRGFTAITFKHFPLAFKPGPVANDDAGAARLRERHREAPAAAAARHRDVPDGRAGLGQALRDGEERG
jgi:hypothetical protein